MKWMLEFFDDCIWMIEEGLIRLRRKFRIPRV